MRTHTCPDCEFVYLGDDLPIDVCPECGVAWAPLAIPTPASSNLEEPEAVLDADERHNSQGPPPTYVGPVLSGILIGALFVAILGYTLRHRLFPVETTSAYLDLHNRMSGMQTARDMAQNRLRTMAGHLVETQRERDEWQQRYEAAEAAQQRSKNQIEQAAVAIAALRRNSGDTYLRHWQLLGPFPWKDGRAPVLVELEPIDLTREYTGTSGKLAWRPVESKEPRLNIAEILEHREQAVCYAICWVESERDRDVLLSIGSDDGVAVWVNRIKFHDFKGNRSASPGQDEKPARLKQGWNEILVRVDNKGSGDWDLYFEFKDPKRKSPMKVFSTYVPQSSASVSPR